ncbi:MULTISPECIES: PglZ domain-containing protein [unclassified Bradyrhizobium]|uniref:PglZ domain-containing protein n=1 Tax=unclassified Bradyrhizobium TaxID=2631580 RepID=UPI00291652AA|nr:MULTISPECIES: PglZ domain-containing protein [unclassified Bradyrhizobium]
MHPLHDYIANQIGDRIKDRRVVVMYDKREELRPFFAEIADGRSSSDGPVAANFGKRKASLYVFDGSFLKARFAVEDMTNGDQPDDVVIYIPGLDRDPKGSLLMELEKAGTFYQQPALKQFARLVLRKRFTDVAIDEMLKSDALTYSDLAGMAQDDGGGEGTSLLKSIFGTTDTVAIVTDWLGDASYDADIKAKAAFGELRDAALARAGLSLPADATLGRARQIALRYVLVNEFRSDLGPNADFQGAVATAIKNVPEAKTGDHHKAVREVAKRLRERYPTSYVEAADKIEAELGLSAETVNGAALGSIDTFKFEEAAVVTACFGLIASEKFEEASALMGGRESSFWVSRELSRKSVWAVCKLMVDLGLVSASVDATIAKANGNPTTWVDRYVSEKDGWYALDQAQRRMEAFLSSLDEEVDDKAKAKIRDLYENTVRRMSEGFLKALQKADWAVPGVLQQTRIWSDVVASRPVPVAYVMVDAMRFEMGHELIGRLTTRASEVQMRPALAALPSITPVGMAALLPGASASFSVVSNKEKIGASIDGTFLPDLSARQKFLKSRIPDLIDLTLDEVISLSTKALQKKIGDSKVIVIRSTEIDAAGENATTTTYARRVMDNVVEDLARCLGRLAAIGIGEAVVTADHGHLFFAADRDPSMRLDTPGGDAIDLHRRCWVGRGGATPAGSVRVPGAKLGYATDLDFAFPASTSVFKSGGDLCYHHGGTSLQEMVIPVIAVKLKVDGSAKAEKDAVVLTHDFDAVTNRIFTVHIELGAASKDLFAGARKVRPIVVSDDRPVARAAIATGADLAEGVLTLPPAVKANVGFMLTDDTVKHVRIQVLDAETDAVLYVSKKDIPVRLGV